MTISRCVSLLTAALVLLLTADRAAAQISTGTVLGTVKDPQGGVIPGATVVLTGRRAEGLAAGEWEHPERRSKRYYRITDAGRAEHARLAAELGPRLDRIARSVDAIREEVLG